MLKELHDELLARMPEGAKHEPATCEICTPENRIEGGAVKTYTEEEVTELETQLADLVAKVKELEATKTETEIEAKIAEARAEVEVKVAELQTQLDAAVLAGETVKQERDHIVAWLDSEKETQEQAAEVARLLEERIAKVREVASFPDEYIDANGSRWAAMDETAFEAVLEDWKNIAAKADKGIPAVTAMHASRGITTTGSPARELLRSLRESGFDPRTI